MAPSNFDVTQGSASPEPLVADDDVAGAGGAGATAKAVGIGVSILVILALIGGVVAWIVMRPHSDSTTTTITTTTSRHPDKETGGPYCAQANWDGDCEVCDAGHLLTKTEGNPDRCFFKCETDLNFHVVKGENKGLCLDDTTHQWCSDNLPFHWPNTNEPVKSIRMFKAWQSIWTEQNPWLNKTQAWVNLATYFKHSGAKVLVGTQVTCDPHDDDGDWEDVKTMMQIIGPEYIMGIAIGNEMELYFQKDLTDADGNDIWNDCMERMWMGNDPYFQHVFKSRMTDLESMPGFEAVPVTSVFGGAVFAGAPPFVNIQWEYSDKPYGERDQTVGMVLSFLEEIVPKYNHRWVWSLNIYPYFDPGNNMDADDVHCEATIARATCFHSADAKDCLFSNLVAMMRQRMAQFEDYKYAGGGFFGPLWVGETGWSAPISDTLDSDVVRCSEFSSVEVFEKYYSKFLSWDMNIAHTYRGEEAEFRGPDHVFWFTIRDSSNFDKEEHFGLVGDGDARKWCTNTTCKLNDRGLEFTTTLTTTALTTTTLTTTRGPSAGPSMGPSRLVATKTTEPTNFYL